MVNMYKQPHMELRGCRISSKGRDRGLVFMRLPFQPSKSRGGLFICSGMPYMLYGADIQLGSESTIYYVNERQNLIAKIDGHYSTLNLTSAHINDTLTIIINGNDNNVRINHPNTLKLTVNGSDCTIENQCSAAKNSIIKICGKDSTYTEQTAYFTSSRPYQTIVKLTAIAVVTGIIAYLLYSSKNQTAVPRIL